MKKLLVFLICLVPYSLIGMNCIIEQNKLIPQQLISHGAPVQSVAWCCDFSLPGGPYAAIGGYYYGDSQKVVRVYNFQAGQPCGQLEEKDSLPNTSINIPESFVYAVDWSCTCSTLLAVGGADEKVHIFGYDGESLSFVNSYTHGGIIYSVKWLCNCCESPNDLLLAIAGDKGSSNAEIEILRVDAATGEIEKIAEGLFGNTVYSIDWCCRNGHAFLAAGGKISISCDVNLRLYCFECDNNSFNQVSYVAAHPNPVYAVRWCCEQGSKFQKLAVGGGKGIDGINAVVYYLINNQLKPVAPKSFVQDRIFAIDWNPFCDCSYVTFGGGCLVTTPTTCPDNIFVTEQDKCELNIITSTKFDDNITSLEWCGNPEMQSSYLLVGSQINDWSQADICREHPMDPEVILYCAAFCIPGPTPLCAR